MNEQKSYKVRRFQNGRGRDGLPFYNFAITIPNELAQALPKDMTYVPELTEDGILFRPASQVEPQQMQLPSWAKRQNGMGRTRPRPVPATDPPPEGANP